MIKKIRKVRSFLSEDIWNENLNNLSRMRAHFIKDLRVLVVTIKTFSAEKIGFQAVALSFFCTMAAVPFMAVAFAITGGLGLEDTLKQLLVSNIPNQQAVDTLFGYAQNVIDTAQSSPVGLVSALLFTWLVLWMMMCVESVFNNVWRVNKSRNIFKRLTFYLVIMGLSPFVVLLFFAGAIVYSNVLDVLVPDVAFSENIKNFLGWVVFAAVSVMTFSAMYKFIPNHYVRYKDALKAALLSGVLFTILQYLF